jgi:hypothetical protein
MLTSFFETAFKEVFPCNLRAVFKDACGGGENGQGDLSK